MKSSIVDHAYREGFSRRNGPAFQLDRSKPPNADAVSAVRVVVFIEIGDLEALGQWGLVCVFGGVE